MGTVVQDLTYGLTLFEPKFYSRNMNLLSSQIVDQLASYESSRPNYDFLFSHSMFTVYFKGKFPQVHNKASCKYFTTSHAKQTSLSHLAIGSQQTYC